MLTLLFLFVSLHFNQSHNLPTFCGAWPSSLASTASMASLAPRNSMPVEGSSRKVLKLPTPLNSAGPRIFWSAEQREKRGEVRFSTSGGQSCCCRPSKIGFKGRARAVYWKPWAANPKDKHVQWLIRVCRCENKCLTGWGKADTLLNIFLEREMKR